jgi:hypothetical protein
VDHPFVFQTTNANDGTTDGTNYTSGITTTGAYGSTEKRTFVVPAGAPTTLYYYCTSHSGMGATVSISPTAELIVSGRIVTTDLQVSGTGGATLGGGTTAQRPVYPLLGTMRYNTTTRYMESYTDDGWGSIAPPPVITGVSPTSVFGGDTATQVFTVTGTGFDAGLNIKLVGADGTEYSVFDATYLSRTSATFKMGAHGATDGYDAAQKPFNVKLIGGSGIASTSEDSITIPSPTITGLSNNTLLASATGSTTITVTGAGFTSSMASGNDVQVLGVDGSTLYNVDSVAFVDATSLTFKLSATGVALTSGQLAKRPYKVRVTGDAGLTATSTATIGFTGISWTSPASGATLSTFFTVSSANNTELAATDDIGGSGVTFSIPANNLPSPLALNAITGAITGTIGAATVAGGVSVTFRVTDNVTGATLDRTFSILGVSPLYAFTSHTFTNAAATGRSGPTLTEARNAYSISVPPSPATPWDEDTNLFNILTTEKGIQRWTVPATGSYTIDAYGARGAFDVGVTAGKGARIKGTFNLTKNQVIKIAVGQEGWTGTDSQPNKPGGGGGTFVWIDDPPNNPLIVAGGGGGVHRNFTTDADGQSGTNAGIASVTNTEQRGYPGQVVGVGHGSWTDGSGYSCSGGGAGWLSEGQDGGRANATADKGTNGSYWKQSDQNCGGKGLFGRDLRLAAGMISASTTVPSTEKLYGGFQSCYVGSETSSVGGFGGAGGGGCGGDGGGGGYTGGASTYSSSHNHGGGGGSYNGGSSQTNTAGSMNGHGSCIITYNP